MNEQIRVRFTSNGQPLLMALSADGLTLHGETGATARRMSITFNGFGEATLTRMRFVRQRKNWSSEVFPLKVTGTEDGVIIAGFERDTLPAGIYAGRIGIDDLRMANGGRFRVEVDEDRQAEVVIEASSDPRQVRLSRALDLLPDGIKRLLGAAESRLDDMPAVAWLDSMSPRASRKACLLNIVAKLAADKARLLDTVNAVYFADVDRINAEVSSECSRVLERLVADPHQPFFAEGSPKAAVHFKMLTRANVPPDLYQLRSYRQQGTHCLQAVVATPRSGAGRHFAEFDIDLGNPLQDIAGLVVHVGELLNPGRTDHFSLREKLLATTAAEFICYDVVEPHVDVRVVES